MQKTLKGLVAIAAFMTLAGAGIANAQSPSTRPDPSVAQSPSTQQPPSSQNPSTPSRDRTLSGELMRVNPDTKMFSVKGASGEIQFQYSDQTVVTGAQKTVAGLATMSGEQVTVSYRVESGNNIATKIDVKEKK
jgi:hypothetical protein